MHNWQVGDLAITCNCSSMRRNGLMVEIVRVSSCGNGDYIIKCPGLRSYMEDGFWAVWGHQLKPLPGDEDDANQVTSWDELIDIYQPGVPVPITVDA